MVIYGWNEIGWKVQNSWGDSWANNGTIIIPYDVPLHEVWGIRDAEASSDLVINKPFKTKVGAKVAKIINYAILFIYDLLYKMRK